MQQQTVVVVQSKPKPVIIVRPQYHSLLMATYQRYMILYEYNEDQQAEYDEEQEIFDYMVEELLHQLQNKRIDNPLERQLVSLLRHYWELCTLEDYEGCDYVRSMDSSY